MYSIDSVIGEKTGGVKRFFELTRYLISIGYDVFLVSKDTEEDRKKIGVKGRTLNISSDKMTGLSVIKNNKETLRYIKKCKFDKVIVFDVRAAISLTVYNISNIYLFLRQDLLSYKKIQLENKKMSDIKKFFVLRIMLFGEYLCLKKAKKIVVQCKYDLDQLVIRHKIIKKQIKKKTVIQINNVNPSWIEKNKVETEKQEKCQNYDLVFIGNFNDTRKGHSILLSALKELYEEGENINTAIIGDGRDLKHYKDIYKDIKNIDFLGRVNNPSVILKNSKLSIVPSYADSCPNTVLESLYIGCPVIGSNRGGIPEILNNSNWIFELNLFDIKEKIKECLLDDNNIKMRKEQEKRKKELEFDWSRKILEIIDD